MLLSQYQYWPEQPDPSYYQKRRFAPISVYVNEQLALIAVALPFSSIIQQANKQWTFIWPDIGASAYRVVLEGIELARVTTNSYTHLTPIKANWLIFPPPIEVLIAENFGESERNRPFLVAQWYRVTGAVYYKFQEYTGGSWITRDTTVENGSWIYTVTTPLLNDETQYNFRVLAYNAVDVPSNPLGFEIFVVRPPEVVENKISVSYNNPTHEIVIASLGTPEVV